ncbi:hypothetical protein VOLCADRAFT_93372 [Volvox carteri f. nagariensis]|uniref:Uncharacterized protein n=1 Tax=Volvox carteri f. nagariensis TaxID=3068 RepID=D8U1Y4_VOLCA|nr:uncharacterized protein VOLCADRAFT_93372 [Volvox carteri f. nagariensis]EFJ46191.1 hypothetical protein VOLCADRAFT_93372 [Volvox carteri f. nagariensis]|eukprot:XP_002952638.1 hypothetical protein VOLCADRAFT_93372 [Volvox carteri f. nagariensis]
MFSHLTGKGTVSVHPSSMLSQQVNNRIERSPGFRCVLESASSGCSGGASPNLDAGRDATGAKRSVPSPPALPSSSRAGGQQMQQFVAYGMRRGALNDNQQLLLAAQHHHQPQQLQFLQQQANTQRVNEGRMDGALATGSAMGAPSLTACKQSSSSSFNGSPITNAAMETREDPALPSTRASDTGMPANRVLRFMHHQGGQYQHQERCPQQQLGPQAPGYPHQPDEEVASLQHGGRVLAPLRLDSSGEAGAATGAEGPGVLGPDTACQPAATSNAAVSVGQDVHLCRPSASSLGRMNGLGAASAAVAVNGGGLPGRPPSFGSHDPTALASGPPSAQNAPQRALLQQLEQHQQLQQLEQHQQLQQHFAIAGAAMSGGVTTRCSPGGVADAAAAASLGTGSGGGSTPAASPPLERSISAPQAALETQIAASRLRKLEQMGISPSQAVLAVASGSRLSGMHQPQLSCRTTLGYGHAGPGLGMEGPAGGVGSDAVQALKRSKAYGAHELLTPSVRGFMAQGPQPRFDPDVLQAQQQHHSQAGLLSRSLPNDIPPSAMLPAPSSGGSTGFAPFGAGGVLPVNGPVPGNMDLPMPMSMPHHPSDSFTRAPGMGGFIPLDGPGPGLLGPGAGGNGGSHGMGPMGPIGGMGMMAQGMVAACAMEGPDLGPQLGHAGVDMGTTGEGPGQSGGSCGGGSGSGSIPGDGLGPRCSDVAMDLADLGPEPDFLADTELQSFIAELCAPAPGPGGQQDPLTSQSVGSAGFRMGAEGAADLAMATHLQVDEEDSGLEVWALCNLSEWEPRLNDTLNGNRQSGEMSQLQFSVRMAIYC